MFSFKKETIVGIVGGMGPAASNKLLELITDNTNVHSDQEHIKLLMFSNPQIPDRSAYLLENQENPSNEIIKSIKKLKKAGATHAALACNTAHAPKIFNKVLCRSPIPIINMVELTVEKLRKQHGDLKTKVCVLGTTGTIKSEIYDCYLKQFNFQPVKLSSDDQDSIMRTIYEIKRTGVMRIHEKTLEDIMKRVQANENCDNFILGCTELSLLNISQPIQIIDPLRILAEDIVYLSRAKEKKQPHKRVARLFSSVMREKIVR